VLIATEVMVSNGDIETKRDVELYLRDQLKETREDI
jgi:hypothetical protein